MSNFKRLRDRGTARLSKQQLNDLFERMRLAYQHTPSPDNLLRAAKVQIQIERAGFPLPDDFSVDFVDTWLMRYGPEGLLYPPERSASDE